RNTPRRGYAWPSLFLGRLLPVPSGTQFRLASNSTRRSARWFLPQRRPLTHGIATCSRDRFKFPRRAYLICPASKAGVAVAASKVRKGQKRPCGALWEMPDVAIMPVFCPTAQLYSNAANRIWRNEICSRQDGTYPTMRAQPERFGENVDVLRRRRIAGVVGTVLFREPSRARPVWRGRVPLRRRVLRQSRSRLHRRGAGRGLGHVRQHQV